MNRKCTFIGNEKILKYLKLFQNDYLKYRSKWAVLLLLIVEAGFQLGIIQDIMNASIEFYRSLTTYKTTGNERNVF